MTFGSPPPAMWPELLTKDSFYGIKVALLVKVRKHKEHKHGKNDGPLEQLLCDKNYY
jgi:hypothetical protein